MIAKLTGLIDSFLPEAVVLDVNGVGYLVHVSDRSLRELDQWQADNPGHRQALLIEPLMRQEQLVLYGFLQEEDRLWFRLLLTVQGVGAKVALSILSAFSPKELTALIVQQDKTLLAKAEGIGPKLASRVVAELKEKASSFPYATFGAALGPGVSHTIANSQGSNIVVIEACSALVNLGYKRNEALEAVEKAFAAVEEQKGEQTIESLIKASLSLLSRPQAV